MRLGPPPAAPEIAACNAGTLNNLKIKDNGEWAWPPMVFDNPVAKVQAMLPVMHETGTQPEFECFDTGIPRSVAMHLKAGLYRGVSEINLVMVVASGMPCDAELLALLTRWMPPAARRQATLIGRAEVWPLHQRAAEVGGMLRSGLEDTFYLPGGERARGNGALIEALAACAQRAGREVSSVSETRTLLGLAPAAAEA